MQTSRYIAKLLGPFLVAVGAGLFLNAGTFQAMAEEFLRSNALIFLSGLIALVAGLAIVIAHNVWVADWRVIITVFGWLSAIGGVVRIVFPQAAQSIGGAMLAYPSLVFGAWVVVTALGVWLCVMGYAGGVSRASPKAAPATKGRDRKRK
jgi:hypothetical protein